MKFYDCVHSFFSHSTPALDAVQSFSFGSNITERQGEVDDVEIANNIVICANGGESEYLGFTWTWEDGEIQEQEVRSKLNDFRKRKVESFRVSKAECELNGFIL